MHWREFPKHPGSALPGNPKNLAASLHSVPVPGISVPGGQEGQFGSGLISYPESEDVHMKMYTGKLYGNALVLTTVFID